MADRVSIAIRQEQATNRLNATAARIAEKVGVPAPTIRTRHQDRELLRAEQFEAIAAWAEALEATLPETDAEDTTEVPAVSPYVTRTKAELQTLADERKLTVVGTGANGNVLVDDLRHALEADDAEGAGNGKSAG